MAGKNKPATEPETPEGDAPETVNVQVKMNPQLARGCNGQIMVSGGGKSFLVGTKPMTVTAAEYRSLSLVEVRGFKAVVRA